jgi:hypothetical protein
MGQTNQITKESFRKFEQDKLVILIKKEIETGDTEKKLLFWSNKISKELVKHPKDSWLICFLGWLMVNYFLPFDDNLLRNKTIVDMDMDDRTITDMDIRMKFDTQKMYIKFILDKGVKSLEELKHTNRREKSMFSGRRHLETELCIITEIEEELEAKKTGTLKSDLSKDCLTEIYNYLSIYITNPNLTTWLYWFGYNKGVAKDPMKWKGTPQQLVNVLNHICDGKTNKKRFLKAFDIKSLPNAHTDYKTSALFIHIESIIKRNNNK